MGVSSPTDAEFRARMRQQEVIAELGQQALETEDLDRLMHEAAAAVADTLDNEYCKVLELMPDGDEVFLRQGIGWREGLVGKAMVPTDLDSQAGYTLLTEEPVIVEDLRTEERFSGPELLTSHDVVSGISVIIGSVEDPWGVLGTHTTEHREFTEYDATFVQSIANILASAIENEATRTELQEVHERITNGILALNEAWEFTHINHQAEVILGYDADELVGKSIWEAFPEVAGTEFEDRYREAMASQEPISFEAYYPPFDAWFEEHVYPSETGLSVYFRDVTERKERESEINETIAELEESEERLRLALKAGEMGTWELDLQTNESPVRSLQHDRIFGYDEPLDDWDFETFLSHVHPDDRQQVEQCFEEAFETGKWEFVCRITRVDGEQRVISAHGEFYFDSEGEPARAVGVVQDVTERTERERELERALDLLEKTERISDVGGWEIDIETMDVFWTDHIFELLQVDSDEEPPLEEALAMYYEEDQPIVEEAVEQALADGEPFDVEVRIRTDSGEVRWLRVQGIPETVDDDVVSLRGAAQDITERKQREQRLEELIDRLEESNQRLEQFAHAASHDLQEPLRMVSSYLQLIEQRYADALDEDGEEFIQYAVDGADRMREMISGLLKYSRVETQGNPLRLVDLDAVFKDVLNDLQVMIDDSDANITADELPRITGDAGQLRQVFQNLLKNAIEFSGDAPPRVHVSAERDGSEWLVSVRDEGIGIDPDYQERIFEVFKRLHDPTDHSGTGIGLALCERIIERHGGRIWVESEPDEGSTFYFTFPHPRQADT